MVLWLFQGREMSSEMGSVQRLPHGVLRRKIPRHPENSHFRALSRRCRRAAPLLCLASVRSAWSVRICFAKNIKQSEKMNTPKAFFLGSMALLRDNKTLVQ